MAHTRLIKIKTKPKPGTGEFEIAWATSTFPGLKSLTKRGEQLVRDRILRGHIFRVPLHTKRKAGGVFDINGLGRAIIRPPIDHNARAFVFDPLPVQRVGPHNFGPHKTMEHAPFGEGHVLADFKLFFDCTVGGHPVVHPSG